MDNSFILLLVLAIGLFIAHKILKKFKYPKLGAMCLVSGGVKTGKSTFSVALVKSEWKRRHKRWKLRSFFQKLLRKPVDEEPLVYSNIPLLIPYVQLTEDLILRKKRFNYNSVVYVNEASLMADSQLIKDMELNEQLLLFNKLIGHELKGGCIIYDTQTISDVHYSIKRCLSEYFYIHHLTKWIPFFLIAHIVENRYSEDNSVVTVETEDTETKLKKVIIPKKTWKLFDCYSYSYLTDKLPVVNNLVYLDKFDSLKATKIVSFRKNRGSK